jgi:hypothetical protein
MQAALSGCLAAFVYTCMHAWMCLGRLRMASSMCHSLPACLSVACMRVSRLRTTPACPTEQFSGLLFFLS